MGFEQKDRLIQMVVGPVGDDEILVTGLKGTEAISQLFSFQIKFLSTKLELGAKELIGKPITLQVNRFDDQQKVQEPPRYISGYINRFSGGLSSKSDEFDYREYRAEVVPWLWFLTQTARSHIFFPEKTEKSIHEVIESVFQHVKDDLHVQPDVDLKGIADLKNRKVEHCVQYRESDFDFLSRRLEQFGVYYYFKHEKEKHTLVLSQKSNYPKCEENKVKFLGNLGSSTDNQIVSWEHSYGFSPGKWEQTDYNFETPLTSLKVNSPKVSKNLAPDAAKYEVYDFPGTYQTKKDGETEARIRQEESECQHDTIRGTGKVRSFTPGFQFNLDAHPDEDVNSNEKGDYLLTSVEHDVSQPGFSNDSETDASYSNSFTCIPVAVAYRPARNTDHPVIPGVQTGLVVGPSGEEIYTDSYGRVKVCFHWDRDTQAIKDSKGENCSCFIRVAQNMAGRKWGFMAIPRIGQEVVVEFIEGDPDRPLIVGSVYNKDQMPHYDPEEFKTRTYFKTNSTKGGDGFNELMFEDKSENELVFVHAQKDFDTRVKNVSRELILGDSHSIVGDEKESKSGSRYELLHKDHHLNIKGNQDEHTEGNVKWMIGNGDNSAGGTLDLFVDKEMNLFVGKDGLNVSNEGDEAVSIVGDQSVEVMKNLDYDIGQNAGIVSGRNIHIKAGMNLVLEAGGSVSLKVGGSFVTVNTGGVFIKGSVVHINSGGSAGSGQGAKIKRPKLAEEAQPTKPEEAHNEKTGQKSSK